MPVCSVITCKYSHDDVDPALDGIVVHRFPKNEEQRAKWIDMTGLDKWIPCSKDGICSRHFRDNDYIIKRSGKRYLKTAAIPCEYVVYRHLYPDEEVSKDKVEAEEAEASGVEEAPAHEDQEPKVIVKHEPELEYVMPLEPQPGPSHYFEPQPNPSTSNQELPDSTIATIYDNENSREWERFQPERYFGQRLPAFIFEDNSQEVDSSGFDERYFREEASSINPFAPDLDLRPHLQHLPLPRTPEPDVPVFDEPERNPDPGFEEEEIPENAPSPVVEIVRGRRKLQDIKKIVAKRKSSRKAKDAGLDEVLEAKKAKEQLQTGEMSDIDKANAIISLQCKRIVKLELKHRRLKKIVKRISAVLRKGD